MALQPSLHASISVQDLVEVVLSAAPSSLPPSLTPSSSILALDADTSVINARADQVYIDISNICPALVAHILTKSGWDGRGGFVRWAAKIYNIFSARAYRTTPQLCGTRICLICAVVQKSVRREREGERGKECARLVAR